MAKYYIDAEFLEGKQDKTIFGIKYGETKPTIDLISIGIVSEDNREYYAISKDFNLKEAWNRWQYKKVEIDYHKFRRHGKTETNAMFALKQASEKEYWIRDNVLKPIWKELYEKEHNSSLERVEEIDLSNVPEWSYKYLKYLINKYGKTNKQIAEEIKQFTQYEFYKVDNTIQSDSVVEAAIKNNRYNPKFYGYYSSYDHVVLCQLFGTMNELPKGFQMYTIDLKQELDSKVQTIKDWCNGFNDMIIEDKLKEIEKSILFPKEPKIHHALLDAKWNKELHKFIQKL